MTDKYLSITIRPKLLEFPAMEKPLKVLIEYLSNDKYIISVEKGKKNVQNHYQIGINTRKHIDTVRRKINQLFKPHLSLQTIQLNKWKKVKLHNNKISLYGYCQKEGSIYHTNIDQTQLEAELKLYLQQTQKKAIVCRTPLSVKQNRYRIYQICMCKDCDKYYTSQEYQVIYKEYLES